MVNSYHSRDVPIMLAIANRAICLLLGADVPLTSDPPINVVILSDAMFNPFSRLQTADVPPNTLRAHFAPQQPKSKNI